MYSILASSFFTYAKTVKTVFLKSFVTDSLHALHLLLKLTFYFCFLEAVITPSNKHIFMVGTFSLHLAPRSFPLCPPSSNLPVSSHSKWIISVSSEKKILICLPFCFALTGNFPWNILSFHVQDLQIAVTFLQILDMLSSCHNSWVQAWCDSPCASHRFVSTACIPRDKKMRLFVPVPYHPGMCFLPAACSLFGVYFLFGICSPSFVPKIF